MQKLMTYSKRKPLYTAAVVVGVLALGWIIVEALNPGITAQLSGAAETVADKIGGFLTALTSIIVGVLALRNIVDDETPADAEPAETEPVVTDEGSGE